MSKTIIGIIVVIVGLVLQHFGIEIGSTIMQIGLGLLGLGVAHKGVKWAKYKDPFGSEKKVMSKLKTKKKGE